MTLKLSLKAARVNVGLTQKELAKLMGKSESTIINWEKGDGKNINLFDFRKICKILKVNPDDIFF
ncbi:MULTISPECIES: helix-turn-helix transcriptional regulator [Gemella]|uniref:helix-turn-helix transcriptional regulator n=1 Tax=Gemella TaxID=1378 RepID=UPI00058DD1E2|nr:MULTISPECIES: helix-turn-helix transcriptional regulator [Gemella]AME09695.1 hypothetical protein AXE85_05775 [Gemella sp. oral taxon 928]